MRRCATVWCRRRDAVRADLNDAAWPFARRRGVPSGCSTHWSPDRTPSSRSCPLPTINIKVVRDAVVHSTPVRDELVAVQTPQGFHLDTSAMRTPRWMSESPMTPCWWNAPGSRHGRRTSTVTPKSPPDLTCVAESVLAQQDPVVGGSGLDPTVQEDPCLRWWVSAPIVTRSTQVSRVVAGRSGPVRWVCRAPDGDVVAHACADAVLNACGPGDLGGLIGTDRAEYRGASVPRYCERWPCTRKQGFDLVNIGVQMIGNRPRIGPRRLEAQEVRAAAGCLVHVSATTTDGLV